MTSLAERYKVPLSLLTIAVAVIFVAAALVIGRQPLEDPIQLSENQTSPATYVATAPVTVLDQRATEDAKNEARNNVPAPYDRALGVEASAKGEIAFFLSSLESNAFVIIEPSDSVSTIPDPASVDEGTTTEVPTSTTLPPEETTTVPPDEGAEETSTTTTTTTQPPTTTTTIPEPERRRIADQIRLMDLSFGRFEAIIPTWVVLYNHHLDLIEAESPGYWSILTSSINLRVEDELSLGIRNASQLAAAADVLANDNRLVNIPGLELDAIDPALLEGAGVISITLENGSDAVARVISDALAINEVLNAVEWDSDKEDAADAVEGVTVEFFQGAVIVSEGERISAVELDALNQLDLLQPDEGTSLMAVAVLGGLAVLLAAFFLWRVAPNLWSEPKHFAILGILVGLAALVSRVPEVISSPTAPEIAYLLPAVIFGYAAAILYDPRTALLISVPVAIFVGISTGDTGLTLYAATATVAPVSFVSAASSRRALRAAVWYSALVMIPLAGSIAWLFHDFNVGVQAAIFGFIGGLIGGLIAQGVVASLENFFRVTTTITLLDLTDRNHPALRHIEENAPGTFNHSILVGTLAGKAARAIDANPLLAQAAAYYHDLGKTGNPQYFIENQVGVSNPHDELEPAESADIIRNHVTEGRRLAREFRIPDGVAAGVDQHHGTGLMRYFYHQALENDPGVDPKDFRHVGDKPRRKEMAILMLCDAVEAAARALAQQEDPTADSLRKLVDAVVGEKVEDRQLDESSLTFGDLSRVKRAVVEALVGYYHARIPYPGFPGPPAEDQ